MSTIYVQLRRCVVMRNGQPGIKIIDSAGTPHHLQARHTGKEVGWSFMRVYIGETTPPDFLKIKKND